MRLINPEYAIYCYTGFGPRFGGGADIHIADECDKNANSYLDYPTSYSCSDLSSKSQENIEQLIDIESWASGVYFVQITYQNKTQTVSFSKI